MSDEAFVVSNLCEEIIAAVNEHPCMSKADMYDVGPAGWGFLVEAQHTLLGFSFRVSVTCAFHYDSEVDRLVVTPDSDKIVTRLHEAAVKSLYGVRNDT